MKRLLAYLFLVLGLGLVVSNFAIADSNKGSIIEICGVDQGYQKITLRRYPNLEKYKNELGVFNG